MKKFFCIILFFSVIGFKSNLYSQTGELMLTQMNDGLFSDVSIQVKRTSVETWKLGYASLVFNYNSSAMINPVEHLEGICDNETSSDYDDQIIVRYPGENRISVELGLTSAIAEGTEIPEEFVFLGTLRFEITSPIGLHNVSWDSVYTLIIDESGNNLTDNITLINPAEGLLPVELLSFTGSYLNNEVILNWITSKEINNYGFEIQRSLWESGNINNYNWIKSGFVEGIGNTNYNSNYTFKERNLQSGKYKYRLKQIDYNGNYEYFMLADVIHIGTPGNFTLYQNYPNPFNPETKIRFEVPVYSKVKITLYDLNGREVLKLMEDVFNPGSYEIKLNANSLSSGTYFYKFESGNFIQTRKLVVLK